MKILKMSFFAAAALFFASTTSALANRCDTLWDVGKTTCIQSKKSGRYFGHRCTKTWFSDKVIWRPTGFTCGENGKRGRPD